MEHVTYTDQEFPIEISHPTTWEAIEGFAGTHVSFFSPREGKRDKFRDYMCLITVEFLNPALDLLAEFSERSITELGKQLNNFKVVEPLSDAELSGYPAKQVTYHHEEGELKLVTYNVWTIRESDYVAYALGGIAQRKDFDKYIPIFKDMIASFKILGDYEDGQFYELKKQTE